MTCKHVAGAILTFVNDYKPGDPPPEDISDYLDWCEWAETQHKAGLRQVQCGRCGLWKYPQELSDERIESVVYRDKAMTKPVKSISRICKYCSEVKP